MKPFLSFFISSLIFSISFSHFKSFFTQQDAMCCAMLLCLSVYYVSRNCCFFYEYMFLNFWQYAFLVTLLFILQKKERTQKSRNYSVVLRVFQLARTKLNKAKAECNSLGATFCVSLRGSVKELNCHSQKSGVRFSGVCLHRGDTINLKTGALKSMAEQISLDKT